MSYESDKEFQRCMKIILEFECRRKKDGTLDDGYVNDPHDPGGETKYGISKRAYPKEDIKNLTLGRALELYYTDYWYVAAGLDWPLNLCAFDAAVNQGTKRAKEWLQNCDKDWKKFMLQREQHYLALLQGKFKNNPNRELYRKSWFRRLNEIKKIIDISHAQSNS